MILQAVGFSRVHTVGTPHRPFELTGLATIKIGLDPTLRLGPVGLAWHGLMIAVGIAVGGVLARRVAIERKLDPDRLVVAVAVLALAGIVGARFYYLAQTDSAALLKPGRWLGDNGFAFYGAIIAGVPAAWLYLRPAAASYLDALAAGFPAGMPSAASAT